MQQKRYGKLTCFVACLIMAIGIPLIADAQNPPEVTIEIGADIDGRSQLILHGNTAQWHHFDYAAPGREVFTNFPTTINNVDWYPIWPDIPDAENRFCNCFSDVFAGVVPALPTQPMEVGLEILSVVRQDTPGQPAGTVAIVQFPSSKNNFTTIVEFNDNGPSGSAFYDVRLRFSPTKFTKFTEYNPAKDFSIYNGNPNGVWSYGWMTPDLSTFTPYTSTVAAAPVAGFTLWYTPGMSGDLTPNTGINGTSSTTHEIPPGQYFLHPGPNEEGAVLRFTAQTEGFYDITGQFFAGDIGIMQVGVRQGSTWLWNATDAGSFTLTNLKLLAGDTIDFIVYGGYGYGNTGLELTINARVKQVSILNHLVTFVPITSTYRTTSDPTGCPPGFVGKFSFDARLTNKSGSPPISDLVVQVKTLTNGNLLLHAGGGDGGVGNGGVGSILPVLKKNGYSDGILNRGESVDVNFSICLKENKPFRFFVDVLGTR